MNTFKLLSCIILYTPIILLAHGNKEHTKDTSSLEIKEPNVEKKLDAYNSINSEYIKNIKPIFEKKCFDCHGKIKKYPWYYSIPGVKQMIDYDIREAKEHIDMSINFPFRSHESPLQDLESLKEVAIEGDMPPFRYLLGHWDTRLSEDEKQTLIRWSDNSIAKLKGVRHE